jgi:uncharacterized protein (DUF4415 family)
MPKKESRTIRVEHAPKKPLTARQKRELAYVASLPDDRIDTSDIPELPPGAWKNAAHGLFYRPVKQAVSLRLDSDIVAWLKKPGRGYQTRANRILREQMLAESKKRAEEKKSRATRQGSPASSNPTACPNPPMKLSSSSRVYTLVRSGL